MNQLFCSYIKHCHPEDPHSEGKKEAQTDQLQNEMVVLKEQLQLQVSEAAQQPKQSDSLRDKECRKQERKKF